MNPVQPEELSAFLDGELSAQRAREVQQRLDVDNELRAQFDSLQRLDRRWHAAGLDAHFNPSIRMPKIKEPKSGVLAFLAVTAALAGMRLLLKVLDPQMLLVLVVNAGVLAGLLATTVWLINRGDDPADLPR